MICATFQPEILGKQAILQILKAALLYYAVVFSAGYGFFYGCIYIGFAH
jgi:hypothetical protein